MSYHDVINALRHKQKHVVKRLLSTGCDVNKRGRSPGDTPLHFAIALGDIEILEMLLDRGADIDALNGFGVTPFHSAVRECNVDIIKMLLDRSPDIDAKDCQGNTPLQHVISYMDVSNCDSDLSKSKDMEIVELLLSKGANVNNPNNKGLTALHIAAERGFEQILLGYLLIRHGAYVNARDERGKTPIFYAIQNSNIQIAKLLLTEGADIRDSPDLLNTAVRTKCRNIVDMLIEHGADINAPDERGMTALLCVLHSCDPPIKNKDVIVAIAEFLITKGAHVNVRLADGTTPLYLSARNGYTTISKMLLYGGANVHAKHNQFLLTALHNAAYGGHTEIVEDLLRFGADIDCQDTWRETPLHLASGRRHPEIVRILLEYGADINIVNMHDYTPLEHAQRSCFCSRDPDLYDSDIHLCEQVEEILKRHILKLHVANFHVNQLNLHYVTEITKDFREECEREIENMKKVMINNGFSFYDILTSRLAVYISNEAVKHVLESNSYKSKFPIYYDIIKGRFWKGVQRKELLERSVGFFSFLYLVLPHNCVEHILNYLSDQDLRILI